MQPLVSLEITDDVALLSLKRVEKMNALNLALFTELEAHLRRLTSDPPAVLIIRGGEKDGRRLFSAGIDLKEVGKLFAEGSEEDIEGVTLKMQGVYNLLEDLPCPTICVVEGFAFGAGMELALSCDFIIAERNAKMGMLETSIGLIPDLGGTSRLVRKIGADRTKQLIFTADTYTAEEMERLGVVNWSTDEVEETLDGLIHKLLSNSREAVFTAKKLIDDVEGRSREDALALERSAQYDLIVRGIPSERIRKKLG